MRTRLIRRASVGALALALVGAPIAFADDVYNNLDSTIDAEAEAMPLNVGGANGSTTLYVSPSNGDGKNGCNLTGSTTLVLGVSSSDTAVATVSPSSLTFTSCGDTKALTISPVAEGAATIAVSQTSNTTGATFNFAPATFTVNVAPPANTAPKVSISGVTVGASYAKGSVPAATCYVTDAEDGPSSFAATLTAITGPYSSDGIGSQTASCSYTDKGGLNAASSVTYSIVDASPPVITYVLSPTAPDGLNGWYKGTVTLTWTVTESESPNSLVKSGCVDKTITNDQMATDYSCSATSAGGPAAQKVTIKRDASVPSGTLELTNADGTAYAPGSWTKQDVTVHYANCKDNGPSGLASGSSCPIDTTLTSEGATNVEAVVLTDNAGNTFTIAGAEVKIDKTAPQTSIVPDRDPDHGQWYNHALGYTVQDTAVDGLSPVTCDKSGTFSGPDSETAAIEASCSDEAGNSGTASLGVKYDASAPTLSPTVSPDPVILNGTANASSGAADTVSGIETAACDAVNTSIIGSGQSLMCSATNRAGLTGSGTVNYSVVYAPSGTCLSEPSRQVLQPVNADGSSVFKQGSTVPVKFRVCDANGASIGTAGVVKSFSMIGKSSLGTNAIDESIYSTTPDSAFRWDATSQQWIFNLSTKNLVKGTLYSYRINLNDGSSMDFKFGVK